jgi:S-adenosyl-L-methionine hydrolase (adenosine-forming)
MVAHPLVTLTTDVGSAYAAQIRAVLLTADPSLRIVDLAVDLAPHDIAEASFLLEHMAYRFPPGSIHLAIVDPGVGSRRDPIAVRTRDWSTLIGPDNGLLDRLATRLGVTSAVRLDAEKVAVRPRVGATFDGRDLFAPAASAVARGRSLRSLGSPRTYRPAIPVAPVQTARGAEGHLVHVDRFGNLITDLPSEWSPAPAGTARWRVDGGPWRAATAVRNYESLAPGEFGLLPSSFGTLEIAVRVDRALDRVPATVGTSVELRWLPETASREKRKYRARVR